MLMNRTLGLILLVVGIIMLIWTGFSYTKREKVVDVGPLQISADKQHTVNWPPYVGGILVIGGIILLVTSKKNP
jgi:drug/metabolite transporter (DMT)-like permease